MFRGLIKLVAPTIRGFSTLSIAQRPFVRPLAFPVRPMSSSSEFIKDLTSAEAWEKEAIKKSQETPIIVEFYAK